MVLGKLLVPGRPTNLDDRRGKGLLHLVGCLDIFLPSIISLFVLPLSGRRPDID